MSAYERAHEYISSGQACRAQGLVTSSNANIVMDLWSAILSVCI